MRSACSEPRVGLLSIGEEETKGNELTREAHRLLKAAPVRFVGNVEARDVYAGVADVIVCDGFTGNVALKISESLVDMVEALLGDELSSTFSARVGYLLSQRAFRRFGSAWTTRNTAARRCSASAASSSSATAGRRPRRCATPILLAHRFSSGRLVERARTRHGRALR